jgi:hypothetical protein
VKERAISLREQITRLRDELTDGIEYDKKRNVYILVWTKRQVANARRRANRLYKLIQSVSEYPTAVQTDRTPPQDECEGKK